MPERNAHFAKRLEQVLDAQFGGKASNLARELGCERATIGTWRRGRVPRRELLRRLTTLTGHSESWFLEGRAPVPRIQDSVSAGDPATQDLSDWLYERLVPELRDVYVQAGVPFTDVFAARIVSDAVTYFGRQAPSDVFTRNHWAHLRDLVVHSHRVAVGWVSSFAAEG